MLKGDDVTSAGLKTELSALEKALARNEKKRCRRTQDGQQVVPPKVRLMQLQDTVEGLKLAHGVSLWRRERDEVSAGLIEDARQCVALGELLNRHRDPSSTSQSSAAALDLLDTLIEEEYQPLHKFVRQELLNRLRRLLRDVGYPSQDACYGLIDEMAGDTDTATTVSSCCRWLTRLQTVQSSLTLGAVSPDYAILELCRPLVERVRYHFVEQSEGRLSSTRIDRLPEWLFRYLREHVFEGGPWELVTTDLWSEDTPYLFITEIMSLARYVLTERQFFQNHRVVGPRSNPLFLSSAIEELLQFDGYIRSICPSDVARSPLKGLTQSLIVTNEELCNWWIQREREAAMAAIFETELALRTESRISPRAELFCALIHAARYKASMLENPVVYLGHVVVPVCMQFLDAIHGAATDLRNLLCQRKIPSDENLENNMEEWIELVNGAHLASAVLLQGDTDPYGLALSMVASAKGDHDLERVGHSMERLRDVLVKECATTVVETLLMDRAKMASYIMRCSHFLSSADVAANEELQISTDLHDASRVFSTIMGKLASKPCAASGEEFAELSIRTNVMDRTVDQFLEVALDTHGMTPEILQEGARVFANDVNLLFGEFDGTPLTKRLLDIARFMTMDPRSMHTLRTVLCELSGQPSRVDRGAPLLSFSHFASDSTLLHEAKSMLRAKGYDGVELEDVVSILNRRKDSFL